jgi:four helix bundle protein
MAFSDNLRAKTKKLALRVLKLFQTLPESDEARIIGNQLFRSASSVAANYRAACLGRSSADFYSKLSIVVEEADETLFWLEMLVEGKIVDEKLLKDLMKEYLEITKILSTSRNTIDKKRSYKGKDKTLNNS